MEVYREIIEEHADGVRRCALLRAETDVANQVYVSYEVIVTEFEEWSGTYSKLGSEDYYVTYDEAYADYEKMVGTFSLDSEDGSDLDKEVTKG